MKSSDRIEMMPFPLKGIRIGAEVPFDILDAEKKLLLHKGWVFTSRLMDELKQSGIAIGWTKLTEVEESLTVAHPEKDGAYVDFRTRITDAIDRGEYAVEELANESSEQNPIIHLINQDKSRPLDHTVITEIKKNARTDVERLNVQLMDLVDGATRRKGTVDYDEMTTKYIWSICQDLDACLSTNQEVGQFIDNYTITHGLQMAIMSMALAGTMGFPENDVRVAGIASVLHDIGMIGIGEDIVNYPGVLDRVKFLEIMKHPILTVEKLDSVVGFPARVRVVVYQIHERENGSGYPRMKSNKSIHPIAKIIGMVDAFLAMISDRPYRKALLPYKAVERIVRDTSKGLWDPELTRSFLKMVGMFPVGSYVVLANGSIAEVNRSNPDNYFSPHVNVKFGPDGKPISKEKQQTIDLSLPQESSRKIVKAIPAIGNAE